MKMIIGLFMAVFAVSLMAQTTVTLTVTLSEEHVWALSQDWVDYRNAGMDTNGVTTNTLTKLQWFQTNAKDQILRAANRRVDIRKQEMMRQVADRWQSLTPEQQTNVINALPAIP